MISACFVVVSETPQLFVLLYTLMLVLLVSLAPKWAADRRAGSKSSQSYCVHTMPPQAFRFA